MPKEIRRFVKPFLFLAAIAVLLFTPILSILFQQLFNFFFFGLLPFTAIQIPFAICLVFYVTGLALIVYWFRRQPLFASNPVDREFTAKQHARRAVMLQLKQTKYTASPTHARRKARLMRLLASK